MEDVIKQPEDREVCRIIQFKPQADAAAGDVYLDCLPVVERFVDNKLKEWVVGLDFQERTLRLWVTQPSHRQMVTRMLLDEYSGWWQSMVPSLPYGFSLGRRVSIVSNLVRRSLEVLKMLQPGIIIQRFPNFTDNK